MTKIYDCFTFFNELDLLELRLEELYDYVDCFVIVESDHTFTNLPKPYYFEENRERFSRFLDKIQHVKIQSAQHADPWENEYHQRECILQGCKDAADNDIIIVSDVDEIPRPRVVQVIRHGNKDISALYTPFFYFKLNFVSNHPICYEPNIIAARKHIVARHGVQRIRSSRDHYTKPPFRYLDYNCETHHHAGWHFSYLGDNEFIKTKLKSFAHADDHTSEFVENYNVSTELYDGGHNGHRRFVKVDEYFPKTVLENLNRYQRYIEPGYELSVTDFLSKQHE